MYDQRGVNDHCEQRGTGISEKVTYDVYYDYARCCELYVEPLLNADEKGHCHGKTCEQQFIINSCRSAPESDTGMQQCEYVNYPSGSDIFDTIHKQKFFRR